MEHRKPLNTKVQHVKVMQRLWEIFYTVNWNQRWLRQRSLNQAAEKQTVVLPSANAEFYYSKVWFVTDYWQLRLSRCKRLRRHRSIKYAKTQLSPYNALSAVHTRPPVCHVNLTNCTSRSHNISMIYQLLHYMFSEGSYNSSGSYSSGAFVELTIWSARNSFGSGAGGCWKTDDRFKPMASLCSCRFAAATNQHGIKDDCVMMSIMHSNRMNPLPPMHFVRGQDDVTSLCWPFFLETSPFSCMVQCTSSSGVVSAATYASSYAMHNNDVPSIAQTSILMTHNCNWFEGVPAFALAWAR